MCPTVTAALTAPSKIGASAISTLISSSNKSMAVWELKIPLPKSAKGSGSVVVEGIAAGFIRFFNQDYEKRIQGYVKESPEREKEKFEKARQGAASDLNNLFPPPQRCL